MLFLTFTGIRITYKQIGRAHIQAALLVVLLSFIHYWWVKLLFPDLAMVGFILGAAPTAAAAAVVANMMKLNVPFVTVSTVLSNLVSVIFIPIALPLLTKEPLLVSPIFIVLQVFITLGIPLIIGQLVTNYTPKLTAKIVPLKPFSFVLFIFNMFIASGNCSDYIQNHSTVSINTILLIAGITCVIGFINFKVGEWTAPKAIKYESGLAIGRKNTMFALWISITYVNPMVGLAPVFYLVFHNVYNSAQLWFLERKRQTTAIENRNKN
ncbi:hypothetical protein NBRC110019_31520 [Neptunitalea chrysea]|uniref:Bile acid:Na+ symporter, BASS family n=2 Tax=Neptunitalea chrysea TaxID=1647581 RepID=A0A9W6EWC2_9FLAO|nr:hypothetical protein NBRC110019_31520 [Neptunitalea chrysea]